METQTALIIPRGDPALGSLRLEMDLIYWAEGRIAEVATVNRHKAPELLAAFNKAWAELAKVRAQLELELGSAENQLNLRKSEVLLDEADAILKTKGLTSSKDLREAVVDRDLRYIELKTRHQTLKVYGEWLDDKAKSLEWAYTSVKKILGDRTVMGGGATAYPHHNGNQSTPVGGNENINPGPRGFGKANL